MSDTNLTQTTPNQIRPPKRLKPKQKLTIEYWFDRQSETFGNLYRSAVKAGFRPSYALNITSLKPSWLYETIESTLKLEQEHIIQGVQAIATDKHVNSKSPADTNLKALELLGNWSGLGSSSNTTNITVVQPILDGASMAPKHVDVDITTQQG